MLAFSSIDFLDAGPYERRLMPKVAGRLRLAHRQIFVLIFDLFVGNQGQLLRRFLGSRPVLLNQWR